MGYRSPSFHEAEQVDGPMYREDLALTWVVLLFETLSRRITDSNPN